MSTNVTPMRIDGAAVEADDHTSVFSPYDGRELGRVPKGTEADVNNAVALLRRMNGPRSSTGRQLR